VSIAIAQRLVRLLCEYCKKEEHKKSYRAVGCAQCQGSGYRGRIGIYEVLEVTKEVEEAILQKASASRIRDIAVAGGMHTMLEDGLAKAAAGKTSIAEILRTTHA
jgi:general secretion pathway protein E